MIVLSFCYFFEQSLNSSIPFHFIPFHFIPFHSISFHSISFHFIPFHSIPFHSISFHFIPFHSISFHSPARMDSVLSVVLSFCPGLSLLFATESDSGSESAWKFPSLALFLPNKGPVSNPWETQKLANREFLQSIQSPISSWEDPFQYGPESEHVFLTKNGTNIPRKAGRNFHIGHRHLTGHGPDYPSMFNPSIVHSEPALDMLQHLIVRYGTEDTCRGKTGEIIFRFRFPFFIGTVFVKDPAIRKYVLKDVQDVIMILCPTRGILSTYPIYDPTAPTVYSAPPNPNCFLFDHCYNNLGFVQPSPCAFCGHGPLVYFDDDPRRFCRP